MQGNKTLKKSGSRDSGVTLGGLWKDNKGTPKIQSILKQYLFLSTGIDSGDFPFREDTKCFCVSVQR